MNNKQEEFWSNNPCGIDGDFISKKLKEPFGRIQAYDFNLLTNFIFIKP